MREIEMKRSHGSVRALALFAYCVVSRLLCFFCLFIGIYACQVDEEGVANRGTLAFRMDVDTALVSPLTKASGLADFQDVNSYAVTIVQDSGIVAKYSRFDKMPAELELAAGAYMIQVGKGTETAAAFDAPYFSGKKEFTIVKDMTTLVEMTAAMANSRVTIDYSDDFLETYKEYTLSLKTNKMELPLVYEKGESRPMYFQSDAAGTKLEIAMELVNVYGKTVNYTATTTIKPKQWAKLTVRTDEKGLNGIAIDVTLNDETKETVYVNIGIPDFMEKLKGAPYIACDLFKWEDTNVSQSTEYTRVNGEEVPAAKMNVTAGGKIASAIMTLKKNNTNVFSYDLANLTDEQKTELSNKYRLEIPENVENGIGFVLDFKECISSLEAGVDPVVYSLSLKITDKMPKTNTTEKSVAITIPAVEVSSVAFANFPESFAVHGYVGVSPTATVKMPAGMKNMKLTVTGTDIVDKAITREMLSVKDGITVAWSDDKTVALTFANDWLNKLEIEGNTEKEYIVTFDIEDQLDRKNTESNSFKVSPFGWAMAENDGDVFAKYVILRVRTPDDGKDVKFYYNNVEIQPAKSLGRDENTGVESYVVTSLGGVSIEGSTTYSGIMAKYDGGKYVLPEISFTTEKEEQLPNAGFEEWSVGPDGLEGHGDYKSMGIVKPDYQYTHKPYRSWERWYPFTSANLKHWDTLNEHTTSVGRESETFSKIGTGDKRWTRYVANSGTIRSEDRNSGNYSALVRTVGWGDGNTGGGDGSVVNIITPGELYLGTYTDGANYGISFKSRPTGLKFKYKYKAKNTDKFIAEIVVKSENEIIAQAALDDSKKKKDTDWSEVMISMPNYINKKATSMYVRFVSGISTSRDDIMSFAPLTNLTTGENVGSQLYIDDVELIYDYPNE